MSISIIVPCYNEEASIPLFYQEATRVLQTMDTLMRFCSSTTAPRIRHCR